MGIPADNNRSKKLLPNRLKDEQAILKNLKIILLDEYSMLRWKDLFHIIKRLRLIKCTNLVFGGVCIVLLVDPSRLPLVWADFSRLNIYQVQILITIIDIIN